MFKRWKNPIYILIQGTSIVAFQAPQRVIYLSSDFDYENLTNLPEPDYVQKQLRLAGFLGKKCILLTARDQWLIDIDKQEAGTMKNLRMSASLIKDVLNDSVPEPLFIEQWIDVSKENDLAYIYTKAIKTTVVDIYFTWLEQCGLMLQELRLASFYLPEVINEQPTLVFTGYPSLCFEITYLVNLQIEGIFFFKEFDENIYFILTNMILQLFSNNDLEHDKTHYSLPFSKEQPLKVNLVFDGVFDFKENLLLETWNQYLINLEIPLELNLIKVHTRKPLVESLPNLTLNALTGASPESPSLSLNVETIKGRNKSQFRAKLSVVAISLWLLISLVLVGSIWWENQQGLAISEELLSLQLPLQDMDALRVVLGKLEDNVQVGEQFIENRLHILATISNLNHILSPESRLERFYYDNGYIDISLLSPMVTNDLLALELSELFSDVQVLTAITNTEINDRRLERVGVRMKVISSEMVITDDKL